MFHSRRLNNKINSIHERALRITYQDNTSTFQELLNKDNFVLMHHRNLQVLATEMFNIFFFFFYLGFLSRTFTIHGTAGEGGGYLFDSSLPLPAASQTLRH